MANRRILSSLTRRHGPSLVSPHSSSSHCCPRTRPHLHTLSASDPPLLESLTSNLHHNRRKFELFCHTQSKSIRNFSSRRRNFGDHDDEDQDDADDEDQDDADEVDEDEEGDEDDEGEMEESSDAEGEEDGSVSNSNVEREYSVEEKEKEAADIGYKVIGPLDPSERPFKYYEPVFAVIQIGSHQFKVSNGDTIYTERLKFCEVNDKLILNRVLMLGSKSQTIIGRPTLPDSVVHAVVEEHALDAKVIIFKKKRRKNYRRTKGHRQELTRLRITNIIGIEKPEKATIKKPEKVAVAA